MSEGRKQFGESKNELGEGWSVDHWDGPGAVTVQYDTSEHRLIVPFFSVSAFAKFKEAIEDAYQYMVERQ